MSILHADFETKSTVDLRAVGLHVYAIHPTTDVICMSYAFGDEHVDIWTPGEPLPARIVRHIEAGGVLVAHNVAFEYDLWNEVCVPRYGWPELRIEQCECTMAMSYAMGLPGALEDTAPALGIGAIKDATGKRLMLQMCQPRSINPDGTVVWWDAPEKMARLIEYCKQDTEVERAIHKRLMPLSHAEREIWLLDHAINARGVKIDRPAILAAAAVVEAEQARLHDRMRRITDGFVGSTSDVRQLTKWVRLQGVDVPGVAKADVLDALALEGLPEAVRQALLVRQESGRSSTAKLGKMLESASADDRLRGMFSYHAASTGRWAARRVQLHNFPRPMFKPAVIDDAIDHIGDATYLDNFIGKPVDVIVSCLRGMLVAGEGMELFIGDFSNVEGRALAWLAGEEWKLQAFRDFDAGIGTDIYKLSYAKAFGVSPDTVGDAERQVGKVQELACLAAETKVLTRAGIKDIVGVLKTDELWDGTEWVRHAGLVQKGVRSVVDVAGIKVTPEHLIKTGPTWTPAQQLASNENILCQALVTGSANLPWSGITHIPGLTCKYSVLVERLHILFGTTICGKAKALVAIRALKRKPDIGEKTIGRMPMLYPMINTAGVCSIELRPASIGAEKKQTRDTTIMADAVLAYSLLGQRTAAHFSRILLLLRDGIIRGLKSTVLTTTKGTSMGICNSYLTNKTVGKRERYGECRSESTNWKPVYDIANAGPRNRFTVISDRGPLIVHNCGYGGGVGAFQTMAKGYNVVVSDERAEEIKQGWREAHPMTVQYWYDVEKAAIDATLNFGVFSAGPKGREIKFRKMGSFLCCRLPSGRVMYYPYPKIMQVETPWGAMKDALTYFTKISPTAKKKVIPDPNSKGLWQRVSTYGGSIVENITQAMARDQLAEALRALHSANFPVVLHVHDEPVVEVSDKADAIDFRLFKSILSRVPTWAPGLPVAAKCSRSKRWHK